MLTKQGSIDIEKEAEHPATSSGFSELVFEAMMKKKYEQGITSQKKKPPVGGPGRSSFLQAVLDLRDKELMEQGLEPKFSPQSDSTNKSLLKNEDSESGKPLDLPSAVLMAVKRQKDLEEAETKIEPQAETVPSSPSEPKVGGWNKLKLKSRPC